MQPDDAESTPGHYGVFAPDTRLRDRLGPLPPLDEGQVAQIESVMAQLAGEMDGWIHQDIDRLLAARDAFLLNDQAAETLRNLHRAAHDLKGLGVTYGFPIVSVIADTLCQTVLRAGETGIAPPPELVNAHVDALRAVVNLNLRDTASSSPATELVHGLRAAVQKKRA